MLVLSETNWTELHTELLRFSEMGTPINEHKMRISETVCLLL